MNCNMKGKTLVISGGTKGIGKECVYKFASNGVNVAFTYNSNAEVAQEICKDVESKFGVKCKAYPFNILEPEKYSELFEEIDKDFDRVDFFISNAIVCGAQQAAKRMQKVGGGAIVSLSSTGNLVYIENYAGHGTNKAAVEAMVRYAANELGEFGIRVNAVSGGPIDSYEVKAFTNYEEVKAKTAEYSPLNRIGQPEDLAQSCYFLCTNDASWITGHTLIVDGGTTFK